VLTLVLYALLAILIGAVLFVLAAFVLPAGEQIAGPIRDQSPWNLPPDRQLGADDVETVRLPVALRGYRFAETDLLLDRLAEEIRDRDAQIAQLRGAPEHAERYERHSPAAALEEDPPDGSTDVPGDR
jgi:hypothetical protein